MGMLERTVSMSPSYIRVVHVLTTCALGLDCAIYMYIYTCMIILTHIIISSSGAGTVACAPLIDVEIITLNQPIRGYLTVSQRGPYEETVVTTTTLPSTAVSTQPVSGT